MTLKRVMNPKSFLFNFWGSLQRVSFFYCIYTTKFFIESQMILVAHSRNKRAPMLAIC